MSNLHHQPGQRRNHIHPMMSTVTNVRWVNNMIPEFALETFFSDGHSALAWKCANDIPEQAALYCRKFINMHEDRVEFKQTKIKLLGIFIDIHRRQFHLPTLNECPNGAARGAVQTFDNDEIKRVGALDNIVVTPSLEEPRQVNFVTSPAAPRPATPPLSQSFRPIAPLPTSNVSDPPRFMPVEAIRPSVTASGPHYAILRNILQQPRHQMVPKMTFIKLPTTPASPATTAATVLINTPPKRGRPRKSAPKTSPRLQRTSPDIIQQHTNSNENTPPPKRAWFTERNFKLEDERF